MNYTSIEQSKKLLELGLSPESADMCYPLYGIAKPEGKYPLLQEKNTEGIPNINIPCWSVGALLEVMPIIKAEDGKNANPFIAKTPEGEYYVVYATLYKEVLASKMCDTSIEAAVDILIYLLEHNYIKQ